MSRPLTAADLGVGEDAVERLVGRVSTLRDRMIVRVENIRIVEAARGRHPLAEVINHLRMIARQGGHRRLIIEGVGVGNARLAQILVKRYGGAYTPQRVVVVDLPLE